MRQFYSLGGRGHVIEATGSPWPCCPRAFLRADLPGASAGAHRVVRQAVRLWSVPPQIGVAAVARLPLIPGVVDLVSLIGRWQNAHLARPKPSEG